MFMKAKVVFFFCCCFALMTGLVTAQTFRGTILGTVTDPSGAVVTGAKVTVKNLRTGAIRETTSNSQGSYMVTNLSPASYEVKAESPGLAATVMPEIPLSVGQERQLNLVMNPEAVSESVTVEAGLTTVDTSSISP